jgi:hypothetical protein
VWDYDYDRGCFPNPAFCLSRLFDTAGLCITSHHRHLQLTQSISHPRPFIAFHSSIVLNDLYSRRRSHCRACSRREKGKCRLFRNWPRRPESRSHFQRRQCFIKKFANVVAIHSRYAARINWLSIDYLLMNKWMLM